MRHVCFLTFAFIQFLILNPVVAGPRVTGNGGNVLACTSKDTATTTYEVLDFFELRVLLKLNLSLDPHQTVDELVDTLIDRVEMRVPKLAEKYRLWKKSFYDEAAFIPNVVLPAVNDAFPVALPEGCEIQQAINQRAPQYLGQNRYVISADIWDKLDVISRAGLLMHEIIYRGLIDNSVGEINSIAVRYMNAQLASDSLRNLSEQELQVLLTDLHATIPESQGGVDRLLQHSWGFEKTNPTGNVSAFTVQFPKKETMIFTNTCHISKAGRKYEVTASIQVKISMDDQAVTVLEDKMYTERNSEGFTCTVVCKKSPGPERYTFMTDGRLVMMGAVLSPLN